MIAAGLEEAAVDKAAAKASADNTLPQQPNGADADADADAAKDTVPTIIGGAVAGFVVLLAIILLAFHLRKSNQAMLPPGGDEDEGSKAANRVHFENPMYSHGNNASDLETTVEGNGSAAGAAAAISPSYETVLDAVAANTDGSTAMYATVEEGGNGMAEIPPPGRRQFNGSSGSAVSSRVAASNADTCTRPSPSGGTCKNRATPGTLFCKGHTCPAQGCTAEKSTKMATCPSHVHTMNNNSSTAGPRPAEGAVFYDASAGASDGTYAAVPALHMATANNDVYAMSTKQRSRGPEQDYVTLNEMPANNSATAMYAIPASASSSTPAGSATTAAPVPEPTKVGSGKVVLGAASTRKDDADDASDLYC